MKALGIDIGSRFIKAALVADGELVRTVRIETSFDPLERCREILVELSADRVIATGYGRHLLEIHGDIPTITEIKAFARGARAFFPGCRTVIDIGGQDTKLICLSDQGKVTKFEMNDRCAAGTGRFLEVMAKTLGFSMEDFAALPPGGEEGAKLSSICTVFAESEVVSLIAKGVKRTSIALAVQRSVATRVAGMAKRFSLEDDVVFAGGCAHNSSLRAMIEEGVGRPLKVAAVPEITGALGAALYAGEKVA